MKIGIASDHRGYELKKEIIENIKDIKDYGTFSEERVDFPDYAKSLGDAINNKEIDLGIAICGTGIGISIALNKIKNIMCAKIDSIEDAKMAKEHNHANAIAFKASTDLNTALKMIDTFINTKSNNEEAYLRRINKIKELENK